MKTTPSVKMKPEAFELKNIDRITIDFIIAVMTKNINALENMFDEKYLYLEGKNKWATLQWFKDQFENEIPEEFFEMSVTEHVSMDIYCGNRSLMFHKGYFPVVQNNPDIPKTLTLDFEDGRIKDIRICYNYLSIEKAEERSKNN